MRHYKHGSDKKNNRLWHTTFYCKCVCHNITLAKSNTSNHVGAQCITLLEALQERSAHYLLSFMSWYHLEKVRSNEQCALANMQSEIDEGSWMVED